MSKIGGMMGKAILKLEPGRETDVLVAREVLGLEVFFLPDVAGKEPFIRQPGQGGELCPHYSTDMNAAWKVVEKFKWPEYYITSSYLGSWVFDIFTFPGKPKYRGEAATAPMAICLAALKAVGIEVEE